MIDLKPACEQMITLVDTVTPDQLSDPTPCDQYRVRDLLEHIDSVSTGFAAIARKQVAEPTALSFADGWQIRVANHVRDLGVAWGNPTAWDGLGAAAGLELANEVWGRIVLTELVVHAWDLATATGQSTDLPEDTLRACLDHVVDFVPNAPIPQLWGSPVELADEAALLDRIVAVTGRTP
ncbi:MAG TPA: TIGR03086 family metal-binding protein [Pseudonocardia sp.]|jgi:uncharacterized protein (TIGR03086 family)|nr:TIGR03086 family metal-binding protein [Pseudonocardia sp.]